MEEFEEFNEENKKPDFDLKAEMFKYLAYWKWLLFGLLVGGLIAYSYNRYSVPKFETEASLMINQSESNNASSVLPSGNSGASILRLDDNSLQNQIVALKSKSLIRKVVDSLNHNIAYLKEGNVITTEAYKNSSVVINFETPDSIVNQASSFFKITPIDGQRFRLVNDSETFSAEYKLGEMIEYDGLFFSINPRNTVEEFEKSGPIIISLSPIENVVSNYIAQLYVGKKGTAEDILSLLIVGSESNKIEDFLNQLMYQFNLDGVKDKRQVAESTTAFIQERLEIITTELDSVEGGIAEFKRENSFMDVASGAMEYKMRSSTAEQEIFQLTTQMELIELIEKRLQQMDNYQLLPSDLGISEAGVSSLISNYNSMVMQRNNYLRSSTPKNPIVESISSQLDSIQSNLKDNIVSTQNSLELQISELSQREDRAVGRFSAFPGLEQSSRNKIRQQEIKEQLYLFLLQRREEAAIAFASTSPVARVVDPAFTYYNPVDPAPWLILLIGLIVGLLIPILVIFIRDFLDTKVHHKGDLHSLISSAPFIGEVPRIKEGEEDTIQLNDRSSLAESFRILRTNLAYLTQNKEKRDLAQVIYVTSTVKGEGKTFISYNLARTLASTNKKVLLIGADIRNPKLHRYKEHESFINKKGLSDYLYDFEVDSNQIISKTQESNKINVDLILSGPIPPNPAELLMNNRLETLLNDLKSEYDYIIVDTAPTMIVTDTLLISQLSDYTIYVVRADFTEKNLLEFPKELKKQGKLKGLAVVLNDIDYSKFSYGAQYGYSYGYGYGYGTDKESRWERLKKKISG